MKKFICHLLLFAAIFAALNALLLFAVPKNRNSYLCEYDHKIELLESVGQPRIIFVGGSNAAFSMDSAMLEDSLHCNVVNFGLHAGIGIRYPFEDCIGYVRSGDIVVLQCEYEIFYNGGNGEPETFLPLMLATGWRRCGKLNRQQWMNIIRYVPAAAVNNLKRLIKYPLTRSFDTKGSASTFRYAASGFNEYGDETSHFDFPSVQIPETRPAKQKVSESLVAWLGTMLRRCESAGAEVIILPPVCTESFFKNFDTQSVQAALDDLDYPYAVEPARMVLDDRCAFDTHYHMNREGATRNTLNIAEVLAPIVNRSTGRDSLFHPVGF